MAGIDTLETFFSETQADIGVLAIPAKGAQQILNKLVERGIKGIWNFAPTDLTHPDSVTVVNVHLSDSLQVLSFKMLHGQEG